LDEKDSLERVSLYKYALKDRKDHRDHQAHQVILVVKEHQDRLDFKDKPDLQDLMDVPAKGGKMACLGHPVSMVCPVAMQNTVLALIAFISLNTEKHHKYNTFRSNFNT
uniref:40S ribosomal protein S15 n=1 Tax=Anisakis simplex TaxID=6269 RepID=A0A0M3JH25_ANISI